MMSNQKTVLLELNENGSPNHNKLICFDVNTTLTITVEPKFNSVNDLYLRTNYPFDVQKPFDRNQYENIPIDFNIEKSKFSIDIDLKTPGAFICSIVFIHNKDCKEDEEQPIEEHGQPFHFVIQPNVLIDETVIPLEGLCMLTCMCRCLGTIDKWDQHLKNAADTHYNMVHLTPLQTLSPSLSNYSIEDCQQFNDFFFPSSIAGNQIKKSEMMKQYITMYKEKYHMLFLTDMVFNHVAPQCKLLYNKDACFNTHNTPQLYPSLLIDLELQQLHRHLIEGKARDSEGFLKPSIDSVKDIDRIMNIIHTTILPLLEDFFKIDMDIIIKEFQKNLNVVDKPIEEGEEIDMKLYRYVYRCLYEKNVGQKFPFGVHIYYNADYVGSYIPISLPMLQRILIHMNSLYRGYFMSTCDHIEQAIRNTLIYRFIDSPTKQPLSDRYRLLDNYFNKITVPHEEKSPSIETQIEQKPQLPKAQIKNNSKKGKKGKSRANPPPKTNPVPQPTKNSIPVVPQISVYYACNNGWVMSNTRDTMSNTIPTEFDIEAEENNSLYTDDFILHFTKPLKIDNCYTRRDMIIWGDCVKLRYYKPIPAVMDHSIEDNEYDIYNYIGRYVDTCASIFDGFRLDNTHNTEISVLEYLLDRARLRNPNLLIVSELFTSDENKDIEYINHIGINMLVREGINSPDPKTLTDTIYKAGGIDLGALTTIKDYSYSLPPSLLPSLVYDLTHDNQSYFSSLSLSHALAISSLLSLSTSSIASTKGFDEFYLTNPSVLETREYSNSNYQDSGITAIKGYLNNLHEFLAVHEYNERYIHSYYESSIIALQRTHSSLPLSVLCISHTDIGIDKNIPDIEIDGNIIGICLAATIHANKDTISKQYSNLVDSLQGIPSSACDIQYSVTNDLDLCSYTYFAHDNKTRIHLNSTFIPGSFIIFMVQTKGLYEMQSLLKNELYDYDHCMRILLATPRYLMNATHHPDNVKSPLLQVLHELNLYDYSYMLYCSEPEEQLINNHGNYVINDPSHNCTYGVGTLPYAGFCGVLAVLRKILVKNDLGHPLMQNIREGDWLIDYLIERLSTRSTLKEVYILLRKEAEYIKKLPRGLKPKGFCEFIFMIYDCIKECVFEQMHLDIQSESSFSGDLAIATLQFVVDLPGHFKYLPSAGLPHFTCGFMRNWGRDTFISFRGTFLDTIRKQVLLTFASTIYNGLIPNLFDNINNPRYNSRDSTWWFLEALQDYILKTNDYSILETKVQRVLKNTIDSRGNVQNDERSIDIDEKGEVGETFGDIIQEIMMLHAHGIRFRERNAPSIDEHMKDEGFNINIYMDETTGFIHGGNIYNCGTWMDKMGSSWNTNKGEPATSRDGAPIEVTCLLASALRWLVQMNKSGHFPYNGVEYSRDNTVIQLKYEDWLEKIYNHFNEYYYIPTIEEEQNNNGEIFVLNHNLVNNRGIYKDVYGSQKEYPDYQFRCNQLVGICVAPFLFPSLRACHVLQKIIDDLYGPLQLGIKTVSMNDLAYRPTYINKDNIGDGSVNCGQSYHNGPEWVWPLGFLLKGLSLFPPEYLAGMDPSKRYIYLIQYISSLFNKHIQYIQMDPWVSLPELTQKDGEPCYDSCMAQDWSISTVLDAVLTIHQQIEN
ncbi:hypothetical protein WA158_004113 [Blastocystis sp. Blastoise]